MAQVAGVNCMRLDGDFLPAQTQYERIERNFTNGIDFRDVGVKGEPFRVFFERFSNTLTNERSWLQALKGSTITVKDERGETHTNMFVVGVSNISIVAVEAMTGVQEGVALSGSGWRTRATLVLEHVG